MSVIFFLLLPTCHSVNIVILLLVLWDVPCIESFVFSINCLWCTLGMRRAWISFGLCSSHYDFHRFYLSKAKVFSSAIRRCICSNWQVIVWVASCENVLLFSGGNVDWVHEYFLFYVRRKRFLDASYVGIRATSASFSFSAITSNKVIVLLLYYHSTISRYICKDDISLCSIFHLLILSYILCWIWIHNPS